MKNFIKGLLIGMLFLPLEFAVLSLEIRSAQAQNLGDEIRSQVSDLRNRPCYDDPRQPCSNRLIPTHRPEPTPQETPTPPPNGPSPTPPLPSATPVVSPSPGVTPTPTPPIGGNGEECDDDKECCDDDDCDDDCDGDDCGDHEVRVIIEDKRGGGPQVLGLSYTGS